MWLLGRSIRAALSRMLRIWDRRRECPSVEPAWVANSSICVPADEKPDPHKLLRRVTCRGGGTGRRTGLKILRSARVVRVRFPPPAITYDELHDAGKRRGRELSSAYLPARQTHALHSGRERAPVSRNGAVGVVLPGLLMHQLTDAARRAVWLQTQTSPRPAGSCRGRRSSGSSPTRRSEDGKTRRV